MATKNIKIGNNDIIRYNEMGEQIYMKICIKEINL